MGKSKSVEFKYSRNQIGGYLGGKMNLVAVFAVLFLVNLLTGCSNELNYCVYEPLVNGKEVTIEVFDINNVDYPEESLEKAVAKYKEYVAGDVRVVKHEPISMDLGEDEAVSKKQFNELMNKREYKGQQSIGLVIANDFEHIKKKTRGIYSFNVNSDYGVRHSISIKAKRIDEEAKKNPFLSREYIWYVVTLHELCHSLSVPTDKSRRCGGHCKNPDCILYDKIDIFSALTAILKMECPSDLCKDCQQEILAAHQKANGEFYDESKTFNRFDKMIELNPGDKYTVIMALFCNWAGGDLEKAISDCDILLAESNDMKIDFNERETSVYAIRGICYHSLGETREACLDFEKSLVISRRDPMVLTIYSFILSSSVNDSLRNGEKAVKLAVEACEISDWKKTSSLSFLACAYAETGDFESAVKYQEQAIALSKSKDSVFVERLELFKACKPYRKNFEKKQEERSKIGS